MAIRQQFGRVFREVRARAGAAWGTLFSNYQWFGSLAPNYTGVNVTERNLLTLASAYACINRISTDISSLPISLRVKRKGGGSDEVTDDSRVQLVCVTPDDGESTAVGQRYSWIAGALGWGTGYLRIYRDGRGIPNYLEIIDPASIQPRRRQDDGGLYYQKIPSGGTFRADEILALGLLGPDGIHGWSPVRLFRQAFALGLAQEGFGASFYGNAATPKIVLTHPSTLSEPAAKRIARGMDDNMTGVGQAHKTLVLEEGMKAEKLTIDPVDAQFLEARRFQLLEVCRIYSVPPHKVQEHSDANYATVEAMNIAYAVDTIAPYCVRIESLLNLKLLTDAERRQGYYFKICLRALLRGDMAARTNYYRNLWMMGALNPDEAREEEDLNPLPDGIGQTYLTPANMVALAQAGLIGDQPKPQPTPKPAARKKPASKSRKATPKAELNGNRTKIFTN